MSHPQKLLESLGAAPRKSLSQNFLVSPHWAERLTDAVLSVSAEEIWEVGPGLGALTGILVKKSGKRVRVFEFDRKLSAYLRETYPDLNVNEGDFLRFDFLPLLPKGKVALLSNLPYHLSSVILFRLLEHAPRWSRLVLTFQKEFAERLIAKPRTKAYGSLSVMTQLSFKTESLGVLPKGAFFPAPEVDSEAVIFEPILGTEAPPPELSEIVKAAFAHRRKKLSRNLEVMLPRESISNALESFEISDNARSEELPPATFLELTRIWLPELRKRGG